MQFALRVYRIRPGKLDALVAGWRAAVVPLRRRLGLTVERARTSGRTETFACLLRNGPESREAANAASHDAPERAALGPDPARLILEATELPLEPVEGS